MSDAQKHAGMQTRVGGLSDEDGKKEIEHNLIEIDGVKGVNVSLDDKTVAVEYDSNVISDEYIRRTLNSLGYSPFIEY